MGRLYLEIPTILKKALAMLKIFPYDTVKYEDCGDITFSFVIHLFDL